MHGMMIQIFNKEVNESSDISKSPQVLKGGLYLSSFREANNLLKIQQKEIGAILAVMKMDFMEYKPFKFFQIRGKLLQEGLNLKQKQMIQQFRQEANNLEPVKSGELTIAERELIKSDEFFKNIPVEDLDTSDISRYFFEATKWIEDRRKQGKNVLVHCKKGNSRAPTIILAYLMITQKETIKKKSTEKVVNWSLDKAQKFLKEKTKSFNPNQGFQSQLQELERFLNIDFEIFDSHDQHQIHSNQRIQF